jgi:hypothetical protein
MSKEYSPRKKLKVDERLAMKKTAGIIPESQKESTKILRDMDLRQATEKDALLELAHQFFAAGGRSIAQVVRDTEEKYDIYTYFE